MGLKQSWIIFFIMLNLGLFPLVSIGQSVNNVVNAFEGLCTKPELITIKNDIDIPAENGHFQGVQLIRSNAKEKLIVSGSSMKEAYLLTIDLATKKTDTLIRLMADPYRHAGGIQISDPYLIVGIEDNILKTSSKVSLYHYQDNSLYKALPLITIERTGTPKQRTAGATGLLNMPDHYLAIVANWDSRNWDFYQIDPEKRKQKFLTGFAVPEYWGSYQSVNLIRDGDAIYAIGFYSKKKLGHADLILVRNLASQKLIMKKIGTKTFNYKKKVNFNAAVGLQVDAQGKLHIWATQTNPGKKIQINKYTSQ